MPDPEKTAEEIAAENAQAAGMAASDLAEELRRLLESSE